MKSENLCPICKLDYCSKSVPAVIKGNYVRESKTCGKPACRKEYQKRWQKKLRKRIVTNTGLAFGWTGSN